MATEMREPTLAVLTSLASGRKHGYAIISEAEQFSGGRVRLKVSTLYAALDRLASEGLVERDGDEAVDGRLRRYFRLTDAGATALRVETERLEHVARAARTSLAVRDAAASAKPVAAPKPASAPGRVAPGHALLAALSLIDPFTGRAVPGGAR